MAIDSDTLKTLVRDELGRTADARVTTHIRSLLVEPTPVLRDWDYGVKGQQYVCWNVLEHGPSNTAIAYCETGFGLRRPGDLSPWRGLICQWVWIRAGSQHSCKHTSNPSPHCCQFGGYSKPILRDSACLLHPKAAGTKRGSKSCGIGRKIQPLGTTAISVSCSSVNDRKWPEDGEAAG